MGLLERIRTAHEPAAQLASPVSIGTVDPSEATFGHDSSRFGDERYGDYLATSNEVFVAASLRARLMAGLDLSCYVGRGNAKKQILTGPAVDLLRTINPFWTVRRLARMDELAMCLWGQTFWAVERDRTGTPTEIWWCKPTRMRPLTDTTRYIVGWVYEPILGGPPLRFTADEIIWFRYPNPVDEFAPLSPLAAARLAADTSNAMMKANKTLFDQGLQLGGLVVPDTDKVTFSTEQARELEQTLDRRWSGVDRRHKWAVLRYEAQFRPLGVSPSDAEFTEGLQLTARQIWNAYGIPAPLLNDLAHATLANTREYERLLWTNALAPDAAMRASEIEEQLLPMFARSPGRTTPDHCEYDLSQVAALQEAASESWAREAQAIDRGAITINEWRASKGMAPVPWGDVFWAPVNKAAVTDATSTPQGDTSPPSMPDQPSDPGNQPGDGGQDPAAEHLGWLTGPPPPPSNGFHHVGSRS